MASNVDLRGQGARSHHTAQTSYLDETFLIGTPLTRTGQPAPTGQVVPGAAGTYSFQVGNLPAGARILRAYLATGQAITGGTATFALGNVSGGAQFVAAAAAFSAAGVASLTIVQSAALYNEAENSQVWATIVVTGTPTLLQSDVIIEYAVTHGPSGQF